MTINLSNGNYNFSRNCLFEKHPLPPIRGRRTDALLVIKVIEDGLSKAKDYCCDLAKIIKNYDGVNEGDLKSIAQLPVVNLENAYKELREIVTEHQIAAMLERIDRLDGEYETIVLSEDIRA